MWRQGWARPSTHGGSQERTRAAARALLKGGRSTLRTQPRVPTGSSTVAGCYHELKSPKPRLGFFLATGTAALLDGSSSATRFLGAQRTRAAVCTRAPSEEPPHVPGPHLPAPSQLTAVPEPPSDPHRPAPTPGRGAWALGALT